MLTHKQLFVVVLLCLLYTQKCEAHGGGDTGPSAKFSLPFQILLLAFTTVMTFGGYFVYDMPGSLTTCFQHVYAIGTTQVELAYSLYNWPNCVLPFLLGYLTDQKLGRRRAALIFGGLTVLGQSISTLGTFLQQHHTDDNGDYKRNNLYLAIFLIGRIVYGFGNESLFVTQMKFISRWFNGKALATAFALTLAISRGGSSANFNLSPLVANGGSVHTKCHHTGPVTPAAPSHHFHPAMGPSPKIYEHSSDPAIQAYNLFSGETQQDNSDLFSASELQLPYSVNNVFVSNDAENRGKLAPPSHASPAPGNPAVPAVPAVPSHPPTPAPPTPGAPSAGSTCGYLDFAMLVGLGVLCLSYLCTMVACLLDKRAVAIEKEQLGQDKDEMEAMDRAEKLARGEGGLSLSGVLGSIKRMPVGGWLIIGICVFFYNTIFTFMTDAVLFIAPTYYLGDCTGDPSTWVDNCNSQAAVKAADSVISIPYTFAMIGATLMGLAIDAVGMNIHWCVTASSLMAFVHGSLYFSTPTNGLIHSNVTCGKTPPAPVPTSMPAAPTSQWTGGGYQLTPNAPTMISPTGPSPPSPPPGDKCVKWGALHVLPIYLLMILMGVAYTMVGAALWPMLVPLIQKEDTATAYGIMDGMQQLGLGIFALVAGAMSSCTISPDSTTACPACYKDNLPKIKRVVLMLFMSSVVSVLLCCCMYLLPQRRLLLLPSRKHAEEMRRMAEENPEKQALIQ